MAKLENLTKLKNIGTRKDLADLLGIERRVLSYTLYKEPLSSKYHTFSIPKKSGSGVRVIKAPYPRLKRIQSRLGKHLSKCLEEIKDEQKFPHLSFAFQKKLSIKDNALKHVKKRWVLNLDISDFFSSINFGRVRGFFLKNKFFQLNDEIATTIAQIACDEQALPQGSPCSPIISEFIMQPLDVRLLKLAKKFHLTYSRYADDITLSTNQKNFPSEVAYPDSTAENEWQVSTALRSIVEGAGFAINEGKTRMQKNCMRQVATGLVINTKTNVADNYYRTVRSMCHHVFEKGVYYQNPEDKSKTTDNLNPLTGKLNFIHDVKKNVDKKDSLNLNCENDLTLSGFDGLYKKFLFYRLFLCLNKPMIVTEGKTDPIYLRCAMENGKYINQPISYFSREKSYAEVFRFRDGGSNNLLDIIKLYSEYLHSKRKVHQIIKNRPCAFPVILLYDNDDGIKTTSSYVKRNFSIELTTETKNDFYYLFDNLYIVKTPEVKNKSGDFKTCIEDCFKKETLEKKLGRKTFNRNNKKRSSTEYGKSEFAKKIISPNAASIDYSGFNGLMARIENVLDNYKKIKST